MLSVREFRAFDGPVRDGPYRKGHASRSASVAVAILVDTTSVPSHFCMTSSDDLVIAGSQDAGLL